MQKYSLIAGIGNPGPTYERTFHNTGILAVEYLAQKGCARIDTARWKSARGKHFRFIRDEKESLLFVIPTDFMNESGRGIKNALDYFGVSPDKLLVVHDDSDLPLGELKISSGQGPAGHYGIASIIDTLGTKEFARARIGIRSIEHSGKKHVPSGEFVLKKISKPKLAILEHVFNELARKIYGDTVTE